MIEAFKRILSWVWNAVEILLSVALYYAVQEAAVSFGETSAARPSSLVGILVLAIGIAFLSGGER